MTFGTSLARTSYSKSIQVLHEILGNFFDSFSDVDRDKIESCDFEGDKIADAKIGEIFL